MQLSSYGVFSITTPFHTHFYARRHAMLIKKSNHYSYSQVVSIITLVLLQIRNNNAPIPTTSATAAESVMWTDDALLPFVVQ